MRRTTLFAAMGIVALASAAFGGDTIYGIDNSRNVLGTFDSASPSTFTDIGPTGITSNFTNSLEWDGSGNLYASEGTALYKINPSTGAGSLVGSHGITNGETITDFTWDGSTMWAIGTVCGSQSSLWKINLSTGAATYVCKTSISGACDVGLVFGADGVFYGHDLVTDQIYSINTGTCATKTVVSLPFDSNFGQGLTASSTTNYHVAFNSTAFQGQLWKFDGAGNYTQLGVLGPLQIAAADCKPGPSSCLLMTVSKLVGGKQGTWTVTQATPGKRVAVVYGFQPGQTVVNNIQGYCATFGIKGVSSSKLICQKVADGTGKIACNVPIPVNAVGKRVLSQAAMQGTCPKECISNLDDQVVQ